MNGLCDPIMFSSSRPTKVYRKNGECVAKRGEIVKVCHKWSIHRTTEYSIQDRCWPEGRACWHDVIGTSYHYVQR